MLLRLDQVQAVQDDDVAFKGTVRKAETKIVAATSPRPSELLLRNDLQSCGERKSVPHLPVRAHGGAELVLGI